MTFNSISDPRVREYMMKRRQNEQALAEAQGAQDMAGYAGIGAQLLNDYNRSQRRDVILQNRLQDMGRGPNVVRGETSEVDPSIASRLADVGMNRARDKMARDKTEFGEDQQLASIDMKTKAKDPQSEQSKQAREFMKYLAPSLGNIPGFDQMSAERLERISPALMQKYRADKDAEATRNKLDIQRQIADKDFERKRQLDRDKFENQMKMLEMKGTKPKSQAELKQKGLAEMGRKSEEQYRQAVSGSDEFDPTSYTDFIDSSSWAPNWMKSGSAIAARSAQDNWIESYLRDASGAAIPESERDAYRNIYFPVMGDTPEVVANKEQLRDQKMRNAEISAGNQPTASAQTPLPSTSGSMRASDLPD